MTEPTLPPVDRTSPVPLYYQIAQSLRAAIGAADQAAALPTELALCRRFRVSRGVVRQALGLLEQEGLIERARGRGTFIRPRRVEHELTRLCSVTDDLRARGFRPGTRLLGVAAMPAPPHIAQALDLAEGEPVWEVYRLRLADDEPVSLQWCYLPVAVAPDLDRQDLSGSLWRLYEEQYGRRLQWAEQSVRTRAAAPEEAERLAVEPGDPLFIITRTIYDDRDEPVQYLHSLWRGDRYDFRLRLSR